MVRVRYNPNVFTVNYDGDNFYKVRNLRIACYEIVPAALWCEEGRLSPGNIEFFADPKQPEDRMTVDVVVDVDAYHYEARASDIEKRSTAIRVALEQLFPDATFATWAKTLNAGWSSSVLDEEADVDMSMEAAIKRAEWTMATTRTTS
jgi:hypothetical protein